MLGSRRSIAIMFAVATLGRGAAAQGLEVAAGVNAGFNQSTQTVAAPDPMPVPGGEKPTSSSSFFTDVRPALVYQVDGRRLTWRFGAGFSAILSYAGEAAASYTSNATVEMLAVPSSSVTTSAAAGVMYGGAAFLASQRAADAGQPVVGASGNPTVLSLNAGQALNWEVEPRWTLQETLSGSLIAPQGNFDTSNGAAGVTLAFEHGWPRDALGIELRGGVAQLRPQVLANMGPAYASVTSSVRARWNHDFSRDWNALATAGVAQVFTDAGSQPFGLVPVGSAIVRYTAGRTVASLDFTQDIATNLLVGSLSFSDQLIARGSFLIDERHERVLAFSLGGLHNQPIGEAGPLAVAATGNVIQSDVGFTTLLSRNVVATARYSISYQFGRENTIGPVLFHLFTVGVIGTMGRGTLRPMPTLGFRVDGSDGTATPNGQPDAQPVVPEPAASGASESDHEQ